MQKFWLFYPGVGFPQRLSAPGPQGQNSELAKLIGQLMKHLITLNIRIVNDIPELIAGTAIVATGKRMASSKVLKNVLNKSVTQSLFLPL